MTKPTRSPALERRLENLRGGPARSPNVRSLATYAQNHRCGLASLAFLARVDMNRLLHGTRFAMPFGQSPFALGRGNAFETLLRRDDYKAGRAVLAGVPGFPAGTATVVNLREGYPKTPAALPQREADTRKLLERILRGDPTAPQLLDGAVFTTPIGGLPAYFEADWLVALPLPGIQVAEIKSFPKVDDRVDPDKLGQALDQAAVYIHLLHTALGELGFDPEAAVPEEALLVTPRNVTLTPTLSRASVGSRLHRTRTVLMSLPDVAEVVESLPAEVSFAPAVDTTATEEKRLHALTVLADTTGTEYRPGCLTTCPNARFCRQRAFEAGNPCLAGSGTLRLLGGVAGLDRAADLSDGTPPTAPETAAAELLARAGRLYDAASVALEERRTA